ncbi:MAG: AI-2E family transporter [Deltaproteobacteria bacterium HGW-Deltaproteobacteria-15]|nr:MAG: AI-2E family transporter [Deltaproteobacteria bacterium HGW-Deltaproteobacteria-15]
MSEHAEEIEKVVVLSIIALLIVGSVMIVLPFLRAILWALVFAVSVWPFFVRIEMVLGGRTGLAAMVPTLLLAIIFFLPSVYVGSRLIIESSGALDYLQELMESGLGPAPLWLKGLPLVGDRLEGVWQAVGHDTPRLIEMVKPHIRNLLGSIVSAGTGMARIILTAILSLIIFFFLLKEGRPLRVSLEKISVRLGGERGRHLLFVAGSTMRAVVLGILGAAVVQGILAIFGLWISGVPGPVFLGTAAGLFALIPIGLIQLVLLPAAGWLIYSGETGWGIFLFLWSLLVVGNIDNVIRPMLISRGAKLPFLVVLLGILGGLAFGGIIGLFVGATLLAVFYTMLKEWVAVPDKDSIDERLRKSPQSPPCKREDCRRFPPFEKGD